MAVTTDPYTNSDAVAFIPKNLGDVKSNLIDLEPRTGNRAQALAKIRKAPYTNTMPTMSKMVASYLAGIIDGEGYIGILKVKRGNKSVWGSTQQHYYTPVLKVAMVEKDFIWWLKESFGGWTETRKPHHNARESYCWTLKSGRVTDFLKHVAPYLRIKKEQAETVFKFSRANDGAGNPVSPKQTEIRDGLYADIRRLNKRGAA